MILAGYGDSGNFDLVRYNVDGSLDTSFGDGGTVSTSMSDCAYPSSVAVQSDGSIVVAGTDDSCNLWVVRYLGNGDLDSSFGSEGKVESTLDGYYFNTSVVTIQSNGKLVVGGGVSNDDGYDSFCLCRFNSDGSLDNSFGTSGQVITGFSSGWGDDVNSVLIEPDGKIVAEGNYNLVRYNSDGSLDTNFGSGGIVSLSTSYYDANSLAIQSDDKLLVGGWNYSNGRAVLKILRFNGDGSIDNSFGTDGEVITDIPDYCTSPVGIAVQSDGKIIMESRGQASGCAPDFIMVRYNADGSLDDAFGSNGVSITGFSGWNYAAYMAIQTDGMILLGGTMNYGFGVARYNTAGVELGVHVANVSPTLAVVDNQTVDEGQLLSLTGLGTFTDPGFDNPLANPPTSEAFTYRINWGDGTDADTGAANIETPGSPGVLTQGSLDGSHTYADNGVYTVTVTLSDDDGGEDVKSFQVTVNNVAPTLSVVGDQTIDEGDTLSIANLGTFTDPGFDNPLANPPTQETFTYTINWGDNSNVDAGTAFIDSEGQPGTPTQGSFYGIHTYGQAGVYTVTASVADDDGGEDVKTFQVTVNNVAPTLTVINDQTANEGQSKNFVRIGTFTDPGFSNESFAFSVDWGDGTTTTGQPNAVNYGSPGTLTTGYFTRNHCFADAGVYTVTVTLSDSSGGQDVKTFQVTVADVAPTLELPDYYHANEGEEVDLSDLGAYFTDPGYNNTHTNPPQIQSFTYQVDWGDGTDPESGDATVDSSGIGGTFGHIDATHTYADDNVYAVTVSVTDDDGGQDTKTMQVSVYDNEPSLSIGGDAAVDEGSPYTLNLSATGDAAVVKGWTIGWGDGNTQAISGNPSTVTHCYAESNADYHITATATDGHHTFASADPATLDVAVDNVAPTLTVVDNQTVNEGDLLNLLPLGTFTDPGFYNAAVTPATSETFSYRINWGDGTTVSNGSPIILNPGIQIFSHRDSSVHRILMPTMAFIR